MSNGIINIEQVKITLKVCEGLVANIEDAINPDNSIQKLNAK